jgi:hypothetical protein
LASGEKKAISGYWIKPEAGWQQEAGAGTDFSAWAHF